MSAVADERAPAALDALIEEGEALPAWLDPPPPG